MDISLNNELVGLLGTVAAIIIFLSLKYFYKERFKENLLKGSQRLVGIGVIIISILIAIILML